MMQELMLFEDTQVEVIEIDSIIYFNPYHVAVCLGLTDSAVRKAISKMTKNQATTLKNSDVKDIPIRKLNNRGELFLTESGVYKLAFKSNKPNAEAFTNWIADEVLPAIRKTGRYELQSNNNSLSEIIVEQSLEIGSLKDRLALIEEAVKKEFQIQTREIVRLDRRYYQLKQENKAIRTTLSLHYKEHNPEAYTKPSKQLTEKPKDVNFQNVECLFNDMKDTYQSFTTSKAINANGGSPIIENTMVFRMVDLNEKGLRFQMTRCNPTTMEIHNVTEAEKRILDNHGLAEYKVYCKGGVEPIIFQAVPKRKIV